MPSSRAFVDHLIVAAFGAQQVLSMSTMTAVRVQTHALLQRPPHPVGEGGPAVGAIDGVLLVDIDEELWASRSLPMKQLLCHPLSCRMLA